MRRSAQGETLKTLTNLDGYRRLFYYPILQAQDNSTLKAIIEVGFIQPENAPAEAYSTEI